MNKIFLTARTVLLPKFFVSNGYNSLGGDHSTRYYHPLQDKMGPCFFLILLWQHEDRHHLKRSSNKLTIERYIEDKPLVYN